MKKPIIAMILIIFIMIIPVNANSIFTYPVIPGEYEDYIIYNSFSTGNKDTIYAVTFDSPVNMHVGTYDEFLEIYPPVKNNIYHSHDILYFRRKGVEKVVINQYKLVDGEWENIGSWFEDVFRVGLSGYISIQNSDIKYASKDVIDLADGSVFFFKGSWMKEAMIRQTLGIIPYLIGLLIVLAAFWKGLQFLYKTLRTL